MIANAGTNATPRESQGTAQRLARATAGADPTSEKGPVQPRQSFTIKLCLLNALVRRSFV